MKAKETMKKVMMIAAVVCVSALPALAETICSGESAEVTLDLATGTMRTPADVETLTYSTEWDGGDAVTLAVNGETLASGLSGDGTYDWTPSGSGLFTLTHTTATSSGDVVLTAAFVIPPNYVAPVYVDNIASNGIAYWTTNAVPSDYMVVESAASRVTWGTAGKTSWYVVDGDVQIDGGVECKGNVNLVLCDGAKLTVTNVVNSYAGIATDATGSFTIYETVPGDEVSSPRPVGILDVTSDGYAAGIGGDFDVDGLNITINGGIVTARAGAADESGAGIGGGSFCNGSNITINGGTVTATSGDLGAGIGGGYDSDGSNITINGGTVTATGGDLAAGIGGGGEGGGGERITINGGTVTATGGNCGAGIGGGSESGGSDIAIRGGVVTAIGGLMSPSIGGGGGGMGENIRIANAVVFVGTTDTIVDEGDGPCRYSADLIGGGGGAGESSSGIVIEETAQVFFNLTGAWDYDNEVWIEDPAPMPETFEGFVIMTPATQTVDHVLVGGADDAQGLSALPFVLTNAVTGATGEIAVNAVKVPFASKLLGLVHANDALTLTATEASSIVPLPFANTTYTIYTNGVPVDVAAIVVERNTPDCFVTYEVTASGYTFTNGLTTITYLCDTSANPAVVGAPDSLVTEIKDVTVVEKENTELPVTEKPATVKDPDVWNAATNMIASTVVLDGMGLVNITNVVDDAKMSVGDVEKVTAEVQVVITPRDAQSRNGDQIAQMTIDVTPKLITTIASASETSVTTNTITEGNAPILITLDVSGFERQPILIGHTHAGTTTRYVPSSVASESTFLCIWTETVKTVSFMMREFSDVIIYSRIQVGADVWADIYDDGRCVISGTGGMWDKNDWPNSVNPLAVYKQQIRSVSVEDGVTHIGQAAFYKFYAVTNVSVAASVTTVGGHAFYNCHSLKNITFAGTTPTLADQAIKYTAAIRMNGSIPEVYTIPDVTSSTRKVWAKEKLSDKGWTDVTDKTDEERGNYHFFKVEM